MSNKKIDSPNGKQIPSSVKTVFEVPGRDYGYMETECFRQRTPDEQQRIRLMKNWKLMHPAIDQSFGMILKALENALSDLRSQAQVTVLSLACGEADEFPAVFKFFGEQRVPLVFIGIDNDETLIENTRYKFRNFNNQQFIAANVADIEYLRTCPLKVNRDPSPQPKHPVDPDYSATPAVPVRATQLGELFGQVDLVILRHPNLTSHSSAHIFEKIITVVAPALLRPGGFLLATMYFDREQQIFDRICAEANKAFEILVKRRQDAVPSRVFDTGELQKLDHLQSLLKKHQLDSEKP